MTEPGCTEEGLEQRICAKNPEHVETRTITATGHSYTAAACTEPSVCTVCGEESTGAIGHDWGDVSYIWSSDNSSVTAKRTCLRCKEVEQETVNTRSSIAQAATCEEKGTTHYVTLSFQNEVFGAQEKDVKNIPATGHNWGKVSYTWASDNSSVTAKRTCQNNTSHVEIETVPTEVTVTKEASYTIEGTKTYTASFTSAAFLSQNKTEKLPTLPRPVSSPTSSGALSKLPAYPTSPYGRGLRANLVDGVYYSDAQKVSTVTETINNRKTYVNGEKKYAEWYYTTHSDDMIPGYRMELYYADGLLFFAVGDVYNQSKGGYIPVVRLYYWGDQLIACQDSRGAADNSLSYAGSSACNSVAYEFGDVFNKAQ